MGRIATVDHIVRSVAEKQALAERTGALAVDMESLTVAHDVREWCLKHGPDPDYRIVLAGFEGEHGSALTDAGLRSGLRERGLRQAAQFSWERAARETVAVYRQLTL